MPSIKDCDVSDILESGNGYGDNYSIGYGDGVYYGNGEGNGYGAGFDYGYENDSRNGSNKSYCCNEGKWHGYNSILFF